MHNPCPHEMIERIRELEELSRVLDPDAEVRAEVLEKVVRHTEAFLDALPDAPACTRP